MLIFDFLEKGLGIVSLSLFVYDFSKIKKQKKCYTLVTEQILPDCLYFLINWSICVVQLFVNQVVVS